MTLVCMFVTKLDIFKAGHLLLSILPNFFAYSFIEVLWKKE